MLNGIALAALTTFRATYVAKELLEKLQEKIFPNHSAVKREQNIFILGSQ